MDEVELKAILKRIGRIANYPSSTTLTKDYPRDLVFPMLTLEEFFEGNDDAGSIWCNLESSPEPQEVFTFLKKILDKPDVSAVYVMVSQWDGPGAWPFSDVVWVVTSASEETVASWIPEKFSPSDMWTDFPDHYKVEKIGIPSGMQAVALWYD